MPLFQDAHGFGMEAGDLGYDFNGSLGAAAIGAEYAFAAAIRAGLTFNIGGGYAQGSGDVNKTISMIRFCGLGAYAGWTKDNFGLFADVNYKPLSI